MQQLSIDGNQKANKPFSSQGKAFQPQTLIQKGLPFLWWLLCCVTVDVLIFSSFFFSYILILFFSIHFGVFIFFRLIRSLWEWKRIKKFMIKGWSLSGLSSRSSLKFALSRAINFLIYHNNTNSHSGSNVTSEERKSSDKRRFD